MMNTASEAPWLPGASAAQAAAAVVSKIATDGKNHRAINVFGRMGAIRPAEGTRNLRVSDNRGIGRWFLSRMQLQIIRNKVSVVAPETVWCAPMLVPPSKTELASEPV